MRYRYETFGGIIASEDPPFLAFVDRRFMREQGLDASPLWQGAGEEIGLLSAPTEVHLAAMLMAGLDGIERRIDPVTSGFGPAETLDPEQVRSLPRNLEEALDALEADHDFLTAGGVFSGTLIGQWLDTCRGRAQAVAERPHPYEFELYFDC